MTVIMGSAIPVVISSSVLDEDKSDINVVLLLLECSTTALVFVSSSEEITFNSESLLSAVVMTGASVVASQPGPLSSVTTGAVSSGVVMTGVSVGPVSSVVVTTGASLWSSWPGLLSPVTIGTVSSGVVMTGASV